VAPKPTPAEIPTSASSPLRGGAPKALLPATPPGAPRARPGPGAGAYHSWG
jgi:hypothetical protein